MSSRVFIGEHGRRKKEAQTGTRAAHCSPSSFYQCAPDTWCVKMVCLQSISVLRRGIYFTLFMLCSINTVLLILNMSKSCDVHSFDTHEKRNDTNHVWIFDTVANETNARKRTLNQIKSCIDKSSLNNTNSFAIGLAHWYEFMVDDREVICNFHDYYLTLANCVNLTYSNEKSNFLLKKTRQLCSN